MRTDMVLVCTKPLKEDSATRGGDKNKIFVTKRPEAAMAAAVGAENKLAGSCIETATAGGTKKKTARVKQEYIDALLARRPIKPFPLIPEEVLQVLNPKLQEKTRACQASMAALIKKARDEEEEILEQYRVKGYAEYLVDEEGVAMGN